MPQLLTSTRKAMLHSVHGICRGGQHVDSKELLRPNFDLNLMFWIPCDRACHVKPSCTYAPILFA